MDEPRICSQINLEFENEERKPSANRKKRTKTYTKTLFTYIN